MSDDRFLRVDEKYVKLVKAKCVSLNKRTVECAAKLIHYFLHWTQWKKKVHRTVWVYQTLKQIYKDFFELHSLHQIRAAIAALIETHILHRRNNPSNGQDKTHQYRIDIDALNTADSTPEVENSYPNVEDSIVESYTQDPTTGSNTEIPPKTEVEKNQELDRIGQSEKVSLLSKVKLSSELGQMGSYDGIPQELKVKLEELSIPLDNRVKFALASNHISQAYSAIAHIENTWESISNPRGVFLYQINKQPIEPMGSRGREYKASDFSGYTLEHIKSMYPHTWKEAARYFGLSVEEEQR